MTQFIQINGSRIGVGEYNGYMINLDYITGPAIEDSGAVKIPVAQARGQYYIETNSTEQTDSIISQFNELLFEANPSGKILKVETTEDISIIEISGRS